MRIIIKVLLNNQDSIMYRDKFNVVHHVVFLWSGKNYPLHCKPVLVMNCV